MTNLLKNNYIKILIVSLLIFLSFYSGKNNWFGGEDRSYCVSNLKFLRPNMDCESLDGTAEKLSSLQEKAEVMIQGYVKTKKVKRASVFVRDLNTSRFAGVNDTDAYYMASLLKTPLLIGGFKLAEVEPRILDQEIVYNGVPNLYGDQVIPVTNRLEVGKTYKIIDLLSRAVIYSDNTAAQILFDYYPEQYMDRIIQALGIQITKPNGEVENFVTARTYANIFRILYNASFLKNEYSNQALDILTKTEYKDGATSKLPSDVTVAHKFAERTQVHQDNSVAVKQFHECGIVYANKGKTPYIFCIMTEGQDYKVLEQVLADISLVIYEGIINKD